MTDVAVIGGGVAGASAAWHLAGRGHTVTLLEQFHAGYDRGSSHGSSRIFRIAYPDPFYLDLAARALPLWRQLEAETGTTVLTLTGALDHGPREATQALHEILTGAGRSHRLLAPEEVAELWPGLRADTSAVFHADAGRLHADDSVAALKAGAEKRGAHVRHDTGPVRVVVRPDDRVEVTTEAEETFVADQVVVAPGGWAPHLLHALGVDAPPLRVTQEQPAHFPAVDAPAWPSFIHHGGAALTEARGVYGLGSVDGVKIGFHAIGPVVEYPSTRDRTIDPAVQEALQAYAAEWLPGVDVAHPSSTTCLYTLTPDHDFLVDRRGPVTVLTGFSGHGFKFGSVLGELAADLVEGRSGLSRFALNRFRS